MENVEDMLQVNEEYKNDEALTIKTNVLSEGTKINSKIKKLKFFPNFF